MKTLKLAMIFVAFVLALILAFNWNSIIGRVGSDGGFVENDKLDVTKECSKIRDEIENTEGWNQSVYQKLRGDIDQSKAMGMFSKEGYNAVNNALRENSANKACQAYMEELKRQGFSDTKLCQQYDAVVALMHAENMENDGRFKNVVNIHGLYLKVRSFVDSGCMMSPTFDAQSYSWTSFKTIQGRFLAEAHSYRETPLFEEIACVPGFKEGVSETRVVEVTNNQKKRFYVGLSRLIVSCFEQCDATYENMKQLDDVYRRYANESEIGASSIAECLYDMKDQLKGMSEDE